MGGVGRCGYWYWYWSGCGCGCGFPWNGHAWNAWVGRDGRTNEPGDDVGGDEQPHGSAGEKGLYYHISGVVVVDAVVADPVSFFFLCQDTLGPALSRERQGLIYFEGEKKRV